MKHSYSLKLAISFCCIFSILFSGIILIEHNQEKTVKTEALEERLDGFVDVVREYVKLHPDHSHSSLDSLLLLFPYNLRLTLISENGNIIYDNMFEDNSELENHASRPEIIDARRCGEGREIRLSTSNNSEYLYYAHYRNGLFVRVALPYDVELIHFLKPDPGIIYYVVVLFFIGLIFIYFVSGRFGNSIRHLRDFACSINNKGADVQIPNFSSDELGEIGTQIANEYKKLKESETKLVLEREKLLQHVQSSAEGVCFFSSDKQVAFYNSLFLEYLNVISDHLVSEPSNILADDTFREMYNACFTKVDKKHFETKINRQGKSFLARVNIFDDCSFEIVLNDITRKEKTRRLKQEMTGNIAHEIRTPVTIIRSYLETALKKKTPTNKAIEFTREAYQQVLDLSELIQNMSLLSKFDEAPASFQFGSVRMPDLIRKVIGGMDERLRDRGITLQMNIPEGLRVQGNEGLLFSVFRNLTDNVVNYAGERRK